MSPAKWRPSCLSLDVQSCLLASQFVASYMCYSVISGTCIDNYMYSAAGFSSSSYDLNFRQNGFIEKYKFFILYYYVLFIYDVQLSVCQ